jgi:CheY-like chemotaxis protein
MAQTKPYIVIAEDDKAYGKVYLSKLTSEGYDVTLVNNGDDVVPTLLKRKPLLLLLDLIMPKKDGFTVLEEIRNTPELQDLRIIVASNLSQDIDKEKVAKYNVYDYYVKADISISELLAKIENATQTP